MDRPIPIIADEHVEREFGTGAVKITPAHDHDDYAMAQRHGLPFIDVMTDEAPINENGGRTAAWSATTRASGCSRRSSADLEGSRHTRW